MIARQSSEAIRALVDRVARLSFTEGRVDVAAAVAGAVLVGDGNVDEGADKGKVKDHGDEGGEGEAGEAAQQEQTGNGVEDSDAGDALDGLELGANGKVVVVQRG